MHVYVEVYFILFPLMRLFTASTSEKFEINTSNDKTVFIVFKFQITFRFLAGNCCTLGSLLVHEAFPMFRRLEAQDPCLLPCAIL